VIQNRNIIVMQWVVIAVLVVGMVVTVSLLMGKANELSDTNSQLEGDNASLHNQVRQLREPTPTPTPTP
jgi:hypothetical protein